MDLTKYLRGLSKQLHQSTNGIETRILDTLGMVGQRAVDIAHNTKTYKDNTGNLSASIGYGVFHLGVSHKIGGFGGGEGEKAGLEKLYRLASDYSKSPYVLILVAGMDYALYVERDGYVVLDGADLQLDNLLRSELNKIRVFV